MSTDFNAAYEINVVDPLKFKDKEKYKIYLKKIIKDDEESLYGFNNEKELDMFNLLIGVSGIGPKTSINLLKSIDVNRLIYYIQNKMTKELSLIPGFNNKAEKIIYELKSKIKIFDRLEVKYEEVYRALLSLGYRSDEVENAISGLENGLSDSDAIKICLRSLKYE